MLLDLLIHLLYLILFLVSVFFFLKYLSQQEQQQLLLQLRHRRFTDDAAERNGRRNGVRDYERFFPECQSIRNAGTRIRNIIGKFGGAAEVAGTNPTVGR